MWHVSTDVARFDGWGTFGECGAFGWCDAFGRCDAFERGWRILWTVHSIYPLARVGFIYWLCWNIIISKYIWYLYIYKYVFINIYYRHRMGRLTAVPDPCLLSRSPPFLTTPPRWCPYKRCSVRVLTHLIFNYATLPVLSQASSSSGVENFTYNYTELSPVPLGHRT